MLPCCCAWKLRLTSFKVNSLKLIFSLKTRPDVFSQILLNILIAVCSDALSVTAIFEVYCTSFSKSCALTIEIEMLVFQGLL